MAVYEPTSGRTVALCCVTCEKPFDHTTKSKGRYPRFCSEKCRHPEKSGRRRLPAVSFCVGCNKVFRPKKRKTICCSHSCGVTHRAQRRASENTRACRRCGQTFVRKRSRDSGRFCSISCAHPAVQNASGLEKTTPMCAVCGVEFVSRNRAEVCSDQCRKARARRQARDNYRPTRTQIARRCRVCAKEFVADHANRLICSMQCVRKDARTKFGKHHRHRARRFGVAYEPVNRLKVFERDGWKCQCCGRPAPRRLMGTMNKRAPELDHRVPLVLGGPHSYENCQLACKRCNESKGGKHIRGQMQLFA